MGPNPMDDRLFRISFSNRAPSANCSANWAVSRLIFSSKVLNALIESGLAREAAYTIVKTHSMRAWREEVPLRGLLDGDAEVTTRLTAAQLDAIFDPRSFLTHVDATFRRLGLGVGVE